ncbi:MAG: MBL fold metallo-hydrolase [Acidobacteria bacterium]|nr:MBL fold metallo-hydrolase [Acidobacteriota bacterium]
MNLTVFQSDKGDCLLLTGADGRMVLVDGGMRASYSKHVAPALGKLRDAGQLVDAVYVSHIDQDHISGVLQMMDDEVEWRIHEFQKTVGNTNHKPPAAPRPPQFKAIWHNAFREQVTKNAGEIEDALAASAAILSGSETKAVKELAAAQHELVTSIAEAIQLSRRVSPEQLGIKLNPPAKGKLMMARSTPTPAIKIGGMQFTIIGPFPADLTELRKEWNEWLKKNKERLKTIQKQAERDAGAFGASEIASLMLPKLQQADSLSDLLPLAAATTKFKLGDRQKVTTPNLASLMFLLKEQGKTVLLTGDGHWADILKGLRQTKKLKATGGLHVDVLKVQHHGSEHNVSEEFCRTITADHYVFCGNGEHENPDLRVIEAIADSRTGAPEKLSQNKQAGHPFKFWFNSSQTATVKPEAKEHMKQVESLVRKLTRKSGGRLDSFFLKGASFNLAV